MLSTLIFVYLIVGVVNLINRLVFKDKTGFDLNRKTFVLNVFVWPYYIYKWFKE